MESKTKHRILGIFVLVAIVILLLPFFQHGKDKSANTTALIKAPPFPAQAKEIRTDNPQQAHILQSPSESLAKQPDDTIVDKPVTNIESKTPDITTPPPASEKPAEAKPSKNLNRELDAQPLSSAKPNVSGMHQALKDKQGLIKVSKSAYAIQMGSFSNKANAISLANNLRSKNYAAFIQQTDRHTRVYVGPLTKSSQARALSQKLEQETHLRGIVVSYKPLVM